MFNIKLNESTTYVLILGCTAPTHPMEEVPSILLVSNDIEKIIAKATEQFKTMYQWSVVTNKNILPPEEIMWSVFTSDVMHTKYLNYTLSVHELPAVQ